MALRSQILILSCPNIDCWLERHLDVLFKQTFHKEHGKEIQLWFNMMHFVTSPAFVTLIIWLNSLTRLLNNYVKFKAPLGQHERLLQTSSHVVIKSVAARNSRKVSIHLASSGPFNFVLRIVHFFVRISGQLAKKQHKRIRF